MELRRYLLIFIFFGVMGCQDDTDPQLTYLGGQITNPVKSYITLYRGNNFIDTIKLFQDNSFSYSFPVSSPGLYTFWHGNESQTIFIEPEDSILFRLNTLAFDKTLYFSGKEAAKNNFLMKLFLLNEKNSDLVLSYYKISPTEFAKRTDSIRNKRMKKLESLNKDFQFSEEFISLARKSINYEFYDMRERYAFLINKYFSQRSNNFPEDYFAYREKVDFNNEQLVNSIIYQRFLDDYLKNRSIEDCGPRENNRECYNLNSYYNLRKRILLVDSLFHLELLRNRFFRRFGIQQIIFSRNRAQIDSTLDLLGKFDCNKVDLLQKLADVQSSYFIGNDISERKLIDSNYKSITLGDVINKPSIIFLWSTYDTEDHVNDHNKIQNLRRKYPEIDFIGFNIDAAKPALWKSVMEEHGYNQKFEYQLRDVEKVKSLYRRNYLDKILFVNEKGIIKTGELSLEMPLLESYILEFVNQNRS